MWQTLFRIDVLGGALLGGIIVFLVLLILGLPAVIVGLGTIAGIIAGGWYGRTLFRQLRRTTRG